MKYKKNIKANLRQRRRDRNLPRVNSVARTKQPDIKQEMQDAVSLYLREQDHLRELSIFSHHMTKKERDEVTRAVNAAFNAVRKSTRYPNAKSFRLAAMNKMIQLEKLIKLYGIDDTAKSVMLKALNDYYNKIGTPKTSRTTKQVQRVRQTVRPTVSRARAPLSPTSKMFAPRHTPSTGTIPLDQINNYQVNTDTDSSQDNAKLVDHYLGEHAKDLREGTTTDTTARKAFVTYLNELLARSDNAVTSEKTSPEQDVVLLKDFLGGAKFLDLYHAAVAEERNSQAFRDAVFLASKKHYEGSKWLNRLVLWVGGPSASGKSYGADAVIKKLDSEIMQVDDLQQTGNDVIFIDGGIEREVSQMRQLVLQAAIKKGYAGIKDLHKHTELGIKGKIKQAALKANLNIAIPSTFTRPLAYKKTRLYDKLENTVQIFSEVIPAKGMEAGFSGVVERLGNTRAWLQDYRSKATEKWKVMINNLHIGIESKSYNPAIFDRGTKMSRLARKYYMKHSKDKIHVEIQNDLIFVHKKDGAWVRCEKGEVVTAVKTSARDFDRWENESATNRNVPDFDVWLRGIPKDKLSAAAIKINIQNNNYILGRLNALTDVASALSENNIGREKVRDVFNDFMLLSIDIMMGNYKSEFKLLLLSQVKKQVQAIMSVDKSNDIMLGELMVSLLSQIDNFVNESERDQSKSLLESGFDSYNEDLQKKDADDEPDNDNSNIRSVIDEGIKLTAIKNLQLITKIISSDKSRNLRLAEIWWEKIEDQEASYSDKQSAIAELENYINNCPNVAEAITRKENLLLKITRVKEELQLAAASANHRLLASFGVYHDHQSEADKDTKVDTLTTKLSK